MSSKEEESKTTHDKKTKKKKTSKSADGKAKENSEELVAKQQDIESEEPVNPEDNVEKSGPQLDESLVDDSLAGQSKSAPNSSKLESSAETADKECNRENRAKGEKKETQKEDKNLVKPMDLEKITELKEAFSLFDFNHDGIIDLQDLKYTFASLGKPDFPEEEMQKMLKEAKEPVDFDSFVALFGYKVSTLDPEEVFTKALSTWDMKEIGMIPEGKFKQDIRCFGEKFSEKDTTHALEEAPVYVTEGVPMIDYAKFSNNICGFQNVERAREYQKKLEDIEARRYQ